MLVAAVLVPSGARSLPAAFPLKASGRVLIDQAGAPFRIQGDAAWSLMANLSLGDADEYLADRQARGFNAVVVNLIEHKYAAHAPANREGEFPFLAHQAGRYDFSTVNPAYFEHVDQVLAHARDRGMLVLLVPMYLGFGGGEEGWWTELTNGLNTKDVCRRYGEWVGKRYKGFLNVIWVAGGDYTPPQASEGRARLGAIVDGIRSVADQPWTGHWAPESHAFAGPAFAAPLDLDAVYTYGPKKGTTGWTYLLGREAFSEAGEHPTFLIETRYEGKGVSREFVRRAMWWGMLSTSSGAVFGNEAVWGFPSRWGFWKRWRRSLASPGTIDFRCLGALLDAIHRPDLVPSGLKGMNQLVVSTQGQPGAADAYVAAAASADGSMLLAYLPPTGRLPVTLSVDLQRVRGALAARWYDPVTGETPAAGLVQGGAVRTFTSPGDNGTGQNDWVLVLSNDSVHPWSTPRGCTGEVASSRAMPGPRQWAGAGTALALAAVAAVYLWSRRALRPPPG